MTKRTTIDWVNTRRAPDENRERFLNPVLIYTEVFNDRLGLGEGDYSCFVIPDDEFTDGASWSPLTTLLLWMDKRDSKVYWGAIGHDYLYRSKKITFYHFDKENRIKGDKIAIIEPTQKEADIFIREKAKTLGSGLYRRWMIYLGLRIGGFKAWNRYRIKRKSVV
jgi:hypothetical protein